MSNTTGFLFPGQASQSVGMGKDWWEAFSGVRDIYEQANELLGYDLGRLTFEGPSDTLNQTSYTQPAVFVLSVAQSLVLRARGCQPAVAAGHSLGQYSALVAAGALSFPDGLRAVKLRGELMQQASLAHPGAMAAIIGLDDQVVVRACREADRDGFVCAANFNAPGQVVISGSQEGVARAVARCTDAGAKRAVMLPVSGAFHCPLMATAQRALESALAELAFAPLHIPVIDNVTADVLDDPAQIRALLVRQLTSPVQWVRSMRRMVALGIERAIEVGPGQVLKGLMRRIAPGVPVTSLDTPQALEHLS